MRILVTGAAGFIGSHLCEALVAREHEVIGLDGFDDFLYSAEPKRETARHLTEALPAGRFELREASLLDRDAVQGAVAADIDVVAHLAALAGVRPSIADPVRYIRTNLDGTGIVLEAMREAGVRRLAFASSSSVYGKRPGADEPFSEDDPCLEPASPYAATKRSGELLCSTYRDLFGIGVSALPFFTVYGPRQRPDMAIHKFVRAVSQGQPIAVFGDGSSRRDYTFIDDIVAGTVAAVERVDPGAFSIYNLGGDRTTSLADLVATVERVVGADAVIDRQPDQPGDVPLTRADITRARREHDYEPTVALDHGVARFWDWYRRRA